jgi:transcriptional regulator with XRE-family HTH domain
VARRNISTGERLLAARARRKLTQEKAAKAIGCGQSWLSKLERDLSQPSISTLRRIADVYGVPLTTLIPA